MTHTINESITTKQLIADAAPPADEVIRAAARTAPTGDAIVMGVIHRYGRWLDELTVEELREAWKYYRGLTDWPHPMTATSTSPDRRLTFDHLALLRRGLDAMQTAHQFRGDAVTPAWITIHANGWICSHPHGPDDYVEEAGHPAHLVNSYALAHLDTYHPGWKLPCARCGRPQWNAEGSRRCFDCRW